MSDTSATEPTPSALGGARQSTTDPGKETGEASRDAADKPPARPVSEIRADIEKERIELRGSFEQLRGELDEAVDEGRQRATDTGKRVKKVAPIVAGALVTLMVARALVKRRRR